MNHLATLQWVRDMTVEADDSSAQYSTNGTTGPFAVPFYFLAASHLMVVYTAADGTSTTLTLTTDYSVSGAGDPAGGSITTVTAYPAGGTIAIVRDVPLTQLTEYVAGDAFPADAHERALDKLTMLAQQLQGKLAQALRVPEIGTLPSIPSATSRADKLAGYDSDGNPIAVAPVAGTATELAISLANTTNASENAGQVGYSALLAYLAGTVGAKLNSFIDLVADFGADPTGASDSLPALNAALSFSYARGNRTIRVRNGVYRLNGRARITQGVMIVCEGSQGSNAAYGTVFKHYGTDDCFVWDGSGAAFAGTGGGLMNALILQCAGPGGTAVKVIATGDDNRPGEMTFSNVLAYAESSAASLWSRGLVIDGSACNTPGARGVRHVHMYKCRFAETSTPEQCIVINQVSHFFGRGLISDVGDGADGDMLLKGINDGVFLSALELGGDLRIVANDASNSTNNLRIDGMLGGFLQVDDAQVNGTADLAMSQTAGYVLLNRSKDLKISSNLTPAFEMVRSAPAADVTGDGTGYSVIWDTENFDAGNNVSTGANTFTCYCAGRYRFDAGVSLAQVGVAHTRADLAITQAGSVARSHAVVTNPAAIAAGGNATLTAACVLDLAYGDTVSVTISASNGAKVVDVFGAGGTIYSWFSGAYL